jgi:hypothetical protein
MTSGCKQRIVHVPSSRSSFGLGSRSRDGHGTRTPQGLVYSHVVGRPCSLQAAAAAAVCVAALSTGCNPFPSFDGLTGGHPEAGATDGGQSPDGMAPDGMAPDGMAPDGMATVVPCPATAVLCEDFEHWQQTSSLWNDSSTAGATAIVDPSKARFPLTMGHSLHLQTPAASSGAVGATIKNQQAGSLPSTYYLRLFLYVPGSVGAGPFDFDFALLSSRIAPNPTIDLQLHGGSSVRLGYGSGLTDPTPFPVDGWTCIEWEVAPQTMHVWMNGAELIQLSEQVQAPSLDQVFLGWQYYVSSPAPQNDVWLDEVILDTSRVGCDVFQQP